MIIAKKEVMDNIRNKWIIILTIIFALLTILVSYAGSLGNVWADLEITIALMMFLVQFIIPIIGLILGYGSIVGEIERGSMNSLLSHPIDRLEIIFGKFIGLGAVLSITILIGFGIAGIIIGIFAEDVNYISYFIFILSSILIGLVFISLSLLFSSYFKKRSSSMGIAIFSWFFFTIIWSFIINIILILTVSMENLQDPNFIAPDWFHALNLVNPLSAYSSLVYLNLVNIDYYLPDFYSSGLMVIILLIWILSPLLLSIILFEKRDI
jgi:ABC-type transport system involved in multi-copper enzyme maturation permease subunit